MRFTPSLRDSRIQVVLLALCATLFYVDAIRDIRAADEPSSALSMERIYASGEFSERGVSLKWAPSGSSFLKREKSSKGNYQDIVFESLDGEKTVVVSGDELIPKDGESARPVAVDSFEISRDANLVLIYSNSRRVWRQNTRGDYWIRDRKHDVFRKLGGDFATPSSLQFAKFSPDGARVAYVFKNNVYVEEIVSGRITQLTSDGSTDVINGTFDWVYEEEFYCRDGFRWSPDGKKIAFWRLDSSREPEFVMLDDVGLSTVTGATRIEVSQINGDFQDASIGQLAADAKEKGATSADQKNEALKSYPSLVAFKYPRVGCENADVSIGVVTLPELGAENFNIEANTRFIDFADSGEYYLPGMEWYDGELGLVVQKTPRSQRECLYYQINPESLEPKLLFSESDPDGAWQTVYPLYPLADGKRFVYVSERSGYRSYYLASCDQIGEENKPFTLENADAIDFVSFDYDDNGAECGAYYYASPENATQRFLYRATFDGENKRVYSTSSIEESQSAAWGFETWAISADAKWGICRRSAFGTPTTIELVKLENGVGTVEKVLQDNAELKGKLAKENLGAFEFFQVEIDEKCDFEKDEANASETSKQKIDGWVIFPPDWDENSEKTYPALVYVYAEPAGQTVVDSWGGSTYLYHQAIAQRGCVVLSFDVRGTPAPKGRAWRKRIYQKFGAVGRSDQANALRAFLSSFRASNKIDASRIGVWGWSGGGTSTLNLMFNYPELYSCGIAIAPVPDYRNYDTIYQERYSGLITETPESYSLGSPIGYAGQLQGRLLIIHGSGDDNCHFQTTEKLINELISCGKDFETFVYPFRSHGIFEGNGTTLHLRRKTMKFWETNLLAP